MLERVGEVFQALKEGKMVEVDGVPVAFLAGDLEPGDFYVAGRNTDPHLLIVAKVEKGIVYPQGQEYPFDLKDCMRVQEWWDDSPMPRPADGPPVGSDYTVWDWLTDCALDAGVMTSCPECGEPYFTEDGHPPGTGCSFDPEVQVIPTVKEPGHVCCVRCGTTHWYEDPCPKCSDEAESAGVFTVTPVPARCPHKAPAEVTQADCVMCLSQECAPTVAPWDGVDA